MVKNTQVCLTILWRWLTRSFQHPTQQIQGKIMNASRESILKSIQIKIIKDFIKDRFNMILVSTALFKLHCNLIHSSQHENKCIICKTNILKFLSNVLKFLSLSFILSFISNCLGLKAYQTVD